MTKGERIRKLRIDKGISQSELAKRLNTTKQTISKYEKGIVTNIPSDKIEAMASLFGVSPQHILGWDEAIKKDPVGTAERHFEVLTDESFIGMYDDFRSLNTEQKKVIADLVRNMAHRE